MHSFAGRIKRAVQLESALYEEVEHDKSALPQAAVVVALSSVAAGVGMMSGAGIEAFFWWTVASLVGWLFWAWVVTLAGTFLLPEPGTSSNLGEMLRVLGFASAPGFLRILGVITPIRDVVFVAASVWMLVATVIAVRQALDFKSTGRAIAVCLAGWLIQAAVILLIAWLSGASQNPALSSAVVTTLPDTAPGVVSSAVMPQVQV